MAKRECCGVYQLRFERLWAALALCSASKAGEITASMVSGVIGCSEKRAYSLLRQKRAGVFMKFREKLYM